MELVNNVPSNINNALHAISERRKLGMSDVIREALVEYILSNMQPREMKYDDDDETLLKNLMAASSFSFLRDEDEL